MDGYIPVIIGVFSVLLGGGGLVAILKFKPETTHITVTSAEKIIILQSDELKRLYSRLNDLEGRVSAYEDDDREKNARIDELEAKLDATIFELNTVKRERDALKLRVKSLEETRSNGNEH